MSDPYGEPTRPSEPATRDPNKQFETSRQAAQPGLKKMLLSLGIASVGLGLVLAAIGYFAGGSEETKAVFRLALYGAAVVAAFSGAGIALVAGFLILATDGVPGGAQSNPDEILGHGRLGNGGATADVEAPAALQALELRWLWSPLLVYVFSYSLARLGLALAGTKAADLTSRGVPLFVVDGALWLQVLAGLLAAYFWLAGLVRLNRSGIAPAGSFFHWARAGAVAFVVSFWPPL